MSERIEMKTIGIIRTPYRNQDEIPIQGRFCPDVEGWVDLDDCFEPGLEGLGGFSHAILLYHFHLSEKQGLVGKPYLEDKDRGVFAMRTPHRPNHIGLTVVRIGRIEGCRLNFRHVDMMDGTPIFDIKPYVVPFDCHPDATSGWITEHFKDTDVPERAVKKKPLR